MRTRQKCVATDTWRSLGCRTTPLEHWSRRKPTIEPRWAKQQTKKLRPKPTKINSFMSGPSLSLTPDPPKREAKLLTVISFTFHGIGYVASIFLVWAQEGSICPPYVKIQFFFMHFQLSFIVLGISASHFLEMTMIISKVVALNQIRMS